MALWVCTGCTTKYAVGLFRCPRCHGREFVEEGQPMPKITAHGGPSDVNADPDQPGYTPPQDVEPAAGEPGPESFTAPSQTVIPNSTEIEEEVPPSPGTSFETSPPKPPPSDETKPPEGPKPAPTTASRSVRGRRGSGTAPSTAGSTPATGSDQPSD